MGDYCRDSYTSTMDHLGISINQECFTWVKVPKMVQPSQGFIRSDHQTLGFQDHTQTVNGFMENSALETLSQKS